MAPQDKKFVANISRLFSLSPYPIFEVNEAADFVHANDAACKFTGHNCGTLRSLNLQEISKDLSQREWKQKWRLLQTEEKIEFSAKLYKKCGTLCPVAITATLSNPIQIAHLQRSTGFLIVSNHSIKPVNSIGLYSIDRDISGHNRTERELYESEEKWVFVIYAKGQDKQNSLTQ